MATMKQIFKYRLPIETPTPTGYFVVEMPRGAKVLHVHSQEPDQVAPFLWALVDANAPKEPRAFAIHGTGHPHNADPAEYLGSAHCGPFVWHVFGVNP